MDTNLIEQLKTVEFEILSVVDSFCRENDIKYSLYAGTMLGAVRHKGFIPWDDDIDIAMTRVEYTKFCEAIAKNPIAGYFFENYENSLNCCICHGKFRKQGTLLLQKGEDKNIGHHEVWVDIFPLDKVDNGKRRKKTERIGYINVLLTRANEKVIGDPLKKRIVKKAVSIIPEKIRSGLLRKNLEKLKTMDSSLLDNYNYVSMSTFENIKKLVFPKEMCEKYTELLFNGRFFMSFEDHDGMLKLIYGNYMKLPPIEERVYKHYPVKIQV